MNAENPSFLIGVVQLPSVAAALTAAGYTVITGDDYRSAATTIRAALGEHGAFPVIVSDSHWPGLRPWAEKIAADTTVVIVRTAGGDTREFANTAEVRLPATLGALLAPAEKGVHEQFAALPVSDDGTVSGFNGVTAANVQQATAPASSPVAEITPVAPAQPVVEETPVQAPQTAPVIEPAAPAASPLDDPWADADAETAGDAFTQSPQPSPVFETQAQPVEQAPAAQVIEDTPVVAPVQTPAVEEQAAPVAPSASLPDDPWEDTTPVAPQAVEVPVVTPAEAMYGDPGSDKTTFEAPAQPVFEPAAPTYEPEPQPEPEADPFAAYAPPAAPVQQEVPVYEPAAPVQQEVPAYEPPAAPVQQAPAYEIPAAPAVPTAPPVAPPAPVQVAPVQQAPAYVPPAPPAPVAPVQHVPAYEPPAAPAYAPSPAQPEYAPVGQESPEQIFQAIAQEQSHDPHAFSQPFVQGEGGALVPVSRHGALATAETGGADVVFTWAGKGGVGKTSTATALAQIAAENGLRVILIDGNYAQGDIRIFLRIGMASLPSAYNYAVTGDLRQTLIDPEMLTNARDVKQEPLLFGLVTAPPPHLADPAVVTPEVYMRLVADARKICDLVVIDTQIVEAVDNSGMVDRFMIPLMQAGAYGFGVTDLSSAGITNLMARLKRFAALGVPREQQVTFLNRVPHNLAFQESSLTAALGEHSVFLGTSYADSAVPEAQNTAGSPGRVVGFAAFMVAALNMIRPDLGIEVPTIGSDETGKGKKRFGGLFGRKGS